ncbi:COG4223 family protein [Ensifer sp. ENS07]|uniref:COG4223 family protein n=1 Tax=Ensifer sp. ENS07 TaxID=2769274 RepID=UPI001786DED7|nr:COG4223 family protein [Ensifer sp. ENS07]MBD9640861.1 COG4223 family protein [Ensifer sp. ENS07]
MVSENPPRRSKSEKEPLTIDLEAEKTVAEPAGPEATGETLADAAAENTAHKAETDEPIRDTSDDSAAGSRLDEEIEEQRADAAADAAAAVFAEEPPHVAREPEPAPPQKPVSNSGALAAGIVGGLVTLLGFGGLRYAGIVPGLGPTRGVEQNISGELQALRDQIAALPTPAAVVDNTALEGRIAALEQSASQPAASGAPSAEVETLKAEVDNLTKELAGLKTALADAQQSATAEKAELTSRIETAEQKLNEPVNDIQMAKAVAVTALKSAIDRGGPFLAELDALRSIAPDEQAVAALAQDAQVGVPTRTDLRREFPKTADAMLDALNQPDPNEGIFDRLVSSAMSGIRVRPVGSVEGETPEAVIARIEDKLNNGDLKGAALEWNGVPDTAKPAGEAFKAKLDQRLRVEAAIDAAVAATMAKPGTEG